MGMDVVVSFKRLCDGHVDTRGVEGYGSRQAEEISLTGHQVLVNPLHIQSTHSPVACPPPSPPVPPPLHPFTPPTPDQAQPILNRWVGLWGSVLSRWGFLKIYFKH